MTVGFVDCETTGLHPEIHEIWEVALILPDERELVWQLPVDLGRADPVALEIGRFHERRIPPSSIAGPTPLDRFAAEFAALTRGIHLAGAVVSFDAERLARLLRSQGQLPEWHYHLIDVEALAVGFLAARPPAMLSIRGEMSGSEVDELARNWRDASGGRVAIQTEACETIRMPFEPPWSSSDLSRLVGVDPALFEKHTALGDARWAKAIYEAVMGRPLPLRKAPS